MESVYHIVTIRVNETSWAHFWRLRSRYLGTGYDRRRGWTGILRRGVLGYVLPRLSFLWSYGVFRCSVPLRVIIVFRDTIYAIIIILYSWHLVIVNTFGRMCETIDPGSCIRWILGFGIKTEYDMWLQPFGLEWVGGSVTVPAHYKFGFSYRFLL
jgi:hypothetical protein